MTKLTHMDETGRARMVDVSEKAVTAREAVAEGFVRMAPQTLALAVSGEGKKGDVRAVAEIAGVMAAKKTAELIPMCHPLPITKAEVRAEPAEGGPHLVRRLRPGPPAVRPRQVRRDVLRAEEFGVLRAAEREVGQEAADVREPPLVGQRAERLQPGERLLFHAPSETAPLLEAEILAAGDFGERTLRFAPVPDFQAILEKIGHMPLPPYIHRDDKPEDRDRYQTVYSHEPGSAAAPTAGLHFTP